MADALARHTVTRLALLVALEAAARLHPQRLRINRPFQAPDHLLAAPRPVVSGDPEAGAALYGGQFTFAGATVDAGGRSIFQAKPPHADWARRLHDFSWLADLCAADTALSRAYARSLIEDWAVHGRTRGEARRPDVAARRFIAWLTYAPILLEDADAGFRRKFLRALGRHAQRLRRDIRRMKPGLPRLVSAIALTQAGLCLPDGEKALTAGAERLSADLASMILPDGGAATRNPGDLLALALDLLPLRELYFERNLEAPRALISAVDRMIPMLRFFRHGDGTLALFNGMGATRTDLLDAVLAIDDTQGGPVLNASFSGYQRLEGGTSVLIADTGSPPPLHLGREAHAGALSFEFSAGPSRLVVNCGAPDDGHAGRRMAVRKTAAHSTVSVGDTSSARFVTSPFVNRMVGPLLRDGPSRIDVVRDDKPGGSVIRASHDGYLSRFGVMHERTLRLSADGARLDGADVVRPVGEPQAPAPVTLSFHLHPDLRATLIEDGRAVLLTLPSGELWAFSAENAAAALEESIYFGGGDGPRRSEQIVIRLPPVEGARVAWSFERVGQEAAPAGLALS